MSAKQSHPFDPKKADRLDDPEREKWLPTAALLEVIGIPPLASVLDFGTGTGRYAIAMARARKDATIFAYDSQEAMLGIARGRLKDAGLKNVVLAGPGMEALPKGAFDRIVGVNVLHEIDEHDLRAIHALLAKKGHAIFVDWDADVERPLGPPTSEVYRIAEACTWLEAHGFAARVLPWNAFPYHFVISAGTR